MENFHKLFTESFATKAGNIVEIGSRDGHDAEKLRVVAGLSPDQVFIVEPHPESARNIRNSYPDFRVFECAVYNQSAILPFNAIPYNNHTVDVVGTSSLLPKNDDFIKEGGFYDPQHWTRVIGITGKMLMELIDQPNFDLVKVDVEGATYEVLESFGNDIRLIKALHLEFETRKLWDTPHTMDDIKYLLNFYKFKEVYASQKYDYQIDAVWCRQD
jgi:FkbM family methyltransferase